MAKPSIHLDAGQSQDTGSDDAAHAAVQDAPHGDAPPSEDHVDLATALLQHLQSMGDSVMPHLPAADELQHLPDDLAAAAALHDDALAHNLDHALDQLTSSPDLFHLPVLDFDDHGGHSGS